MELKVYVILVNWNGWADCVECIESIVRSDYANYEIILVDNCSSDGSMQRIRDWAEGKAPSEPHATPPPALSTGPARVGQLHYVEYSSAQIEEAMLGGGVLESPVRASGVGGSGRLVLIASGRNGGFGGGNNVALKLIQLRGDGDLVWLLNSDTVVTPSAMSRMACRARETRGIVGGTVYYYNQPERVQVYGGSRLYRTTGLVRTETRRRPARVDYINGACFMFGADVMRAVGLFDENIFMYVEEVDYCIRAARKGFSCAISDAVVYHKIGGASKNLDDSFAWANVLKNKAYVLRKHYGYGLWYPIYLASVILFALGFAASRGKRKAARTVVAGWWRNMLDERKN